MRRTLDRLLDTTTPANRCLIAIAMSAPWFCVFWGINAMALVDPDIARGVRREVMLALQAILAVVLFISMGLVYWLWPRRKSIERVPAATKMVAYTVGLGFLALMLASGPLTTGMSLIMLGVLTVGLLLFNLHIILRVFWLCIALVLLNDALVVTGVTPYAPAITAQAFDGLVPTWWWSFWRNAVFYAGWSAILVLILLLFTKLDSLHHQLAKLSYTDVLTGLANRRYFMERLIAESKRFARSNVPYSLLLVDVDHFKRINDRYGHHAGDDVLRGLAQVLTEGIRTPTDQSARIGGEEFALLLPDTSLAATDIVCRRITDALRRHPFTAKGETFYLTISMGVVECRGESIEAVWKQADRNLYKAKQDGRDRVVGSLVVEVAP